MVEARVRESIPLLLRAGLDELKSTVKTMAWIGAIILGVLCAAGAYLGLLPLPDEQPSPPTTGGFLLSVFGAGIAAIGLYGVLWILSWPKRGVISILGLVMAAVGLLLEVGID
jgi:hypothetical protein